MFIVLDLETTGLLHKEDSIIEVAFLKIDRKTFQEVDRFHSFVNPQRDIPELISSITHIFQSDVQDAPVFWDIQQDIQDFIGWYPLIGHNISFDLRFLEVYGIDTSKNPSIDTFFFANFLVPESKSLNLWYLCELFGISLENAHRAIDDTLATREVFAHLIGKLQTLSFQETKLLYYYFSQAQDVGIKIVRDTYLIIPETPPSREEVIEIYIRSLEKNIRDIQDISQENITLKLDEFLSKIPSFELRENQKKMLDKVDKTLSAWEKVLIEAPTGIGKTFAYLLPAISYSLRTGECVHISTSTKALQDQIYYKDLAYLEKHFPAQFSYTKLKGKRNYLSPSALLEFLDTSYLLPASNISFILKVLLWSMKTDLGELDDLDFYGEEYQFLAEIHAGSINIFDEANPYKHLEFALRARKKAKSANIVITNNHILFQDIISEGSLLWGVKNLILDEAHSLEDVVTQALKKTFSFQYLQQLFQKLDKKVLKYKLVLDEIAVKKQQVLYDTAELFSLLEGKIFESFSQDAKYKTLLLQQKFFAENPHCWLLAHKIFESVDQVKKFFESQDEKYLSFFTAELQELSFIQVTLAEVFFAPDCTKSIYYISFEEQKGTQLHTTILNPGNFLQEHLWSQLESAVLTSATLQMEDTFSYIQKMLRVEDFETLALPSDFDYQKQALLFIPQDLGNVKNNTTEIVSFLRQFFETVRGRTLVLFTAFFMIREVFSKLKIPLETQGIQIYAQSLWGSKLKQIEAFKKHPESSILLWTDTFWEGIDIPWEDLQYLVIHKIPFQVPTDPIFQARSALFQDSFQQYAIPKSILKLKQGFWRLIRTKKDTGVVVFLDDRIFTTQWWKRYFEAFPKDMKVRYGSTQKLIEILQKSE